VQDCELTQVAIDGRLTLIPFEAMNHWNSDGPFNVHVFHKNNELAGYSSPCSTPCRSQYRPVTTDVGCVPW
jgi:hypothetical protein